MFIDIYKLRFSAKSTCQIIVFKSKNQGLWGYTVAMDTDPGQTLQVDVLVLNVSRQYGIGILCAPGDLWCVWCFCGIASFLLVGDIIDNVKVHTCRSQIRREFQDPALGRDSPMNGLTTPVAIRLSQIMGSIITRLIQLCPFSSVLGDGRHDW